MTTKDSKRQPQQWGTLKTVLVVGSLTATLAGTRLLALQEPVVQTAVNTQNPVVVVVPAPETTPLPLPPNLAGNSRGVQVELAPVPKAVSPQINPVQKTQQSQPSQPVARSRSSK